MGLQTVALGEGTIPEPSRLVPPAAAMSAMTSARTRQLALSDSRWLGAWQSLEVRVSEALTNTGLCDPFAWVELLDEDNLDQSATALSAACGGFLAPSGVALNHQLTALLGLQHAAQAVVVESAERQADVSEVQLSVEKILGAHASQAEDSSVELRRLEAVRLTALPQAWVCRRHRRRAAATDETERADAETAERARWADEVVGVVL